MHLTEKLPVAEYFCSLQGEGSFSGLPAWFIRLAGCNIRCQWCDSKETWIENERQRTDIRQLIRSIAGHPVSTMVITGGEPLCHNLSALCTILKENGFRRHLETSGAEPLSGEWDWICLSPKKHKPPLKEMYQHANELKVIISGTDDFLWALSCAELCARDCQLFVQPEWNNRLAIIPLIIPFLQQNPTWRLSLQMHKLIDIP